MNAEKIIDGLRYCDESAGLCIGCPLDMDFKDDKYCNIRLQAADLIESLQAQLAAKETTLNGTYISMDAHEREVKKLKAEIGYEQDRIDCRNPVCNGNREGMYRKCAELEELLEAAIAGQETLQKAFAESQHRERAAVRDLKYLGDCSTCRHNQYPCEMEDAGHECWQWRGPVED